MSHPCGTDHRRLRSRRPGDAGDTLIEILVAVAIIGISATGILGGLAAALGSSGTHRSLTNLDAIVRTFAQTATYDLQLRPSNQGGPEFEPCANLSGGATVSDYQVVSIPYPSSGPVNTAVAVFGSGFTPNSGTVSVTLTHTGSGSPTQTTVPTTGQVDANGNVTATFNIPPTLTPGEVESITLSDGATSPVSSASTVPFTVTTPSPSAPAVSVSPLAQYQVGLTAIQYWNGSAFAGNCSTSLPYEQLQQLTINATAPGANDQLNFVVADPNYVFPPPVVATVINQTLGSGSAPLTGFVANGASFYVYALVTDPDGGPGIKSVTADISSLSSDPSAQIPIPLQSGSFPLTNPDGTTVTYGWRSVQAYTAKVHPEGVVNYTVNATDKDALPSEYTDNGSVTYDNTPPTSTISVAADSNGYTTSAPVVSFDANDATGSGPNWSTGMISRHSSPLLAGKCNSWGTYGSVTTNPGEGPSSWTDMTALPGFCYQYQYNIADNVGNDETNPSTSNIVMYDGTPPSAPTFSFSAENNVSATPTTVLWAAFAPNGGSFNVTANSTDAESGIASVRFFNQPPGWTRTVVNGQPFTRNYSWSGSNPPPSTGLVTVTANATNGAGLTSPNASFTLKPWTGRPLPAVSATLDPRGNSISVAFSVPDDGQGTDLTKGVLTRNEGTLSSTGCSGPFVNPQPLGTGVSSPYDDTGLTTGCYQYTYVVPDNLGNPSLPALSNTVIVDQTPPTVTITAYPSDGGTYTTSTWTGTIMGTASDPLSGIQSVTVAIRDTTHPPATQWWDGVAFDSPSPTFFPATVTTGWTWPFLATKLTDGDSYQVIAQATNNGQTSSQASATFNG